MPVAPIQRSQPNCHCPLAGCPCESFAAPQNTAFRSRGGVSSTPRPFPVIASAAKQSIFRFSVYEVTMDCVAALAMTGIQFRDLAALIARGLHLRLPSSILRAQGRPGACCTRGLACDLRKQNCTRAYRAAGTLRPSLRNGFTAYFVLSPVNGSFATVAAQEINPTQLVASTAASGPHDFAVRSSLRSSVAARASIASHRTFVTMANAPHLP